ncbi:MAG: catechol 2,3-dioxygenase-like lactoylglutathione lyase family enzyme [Cyclobacteriaceae bacterium]|jgi:catechol 2,3-dioxygenase-like lactoylglutathione lyase family enzyme
MSAPIISGIQQIGIGVKNVKEAWSWYKKYLGFDVRVFEDAAVANYMLPYTGGEPRERYAALSLNLQGGGGFEIWSYTKRVSAPPKEPIKLGDLGIFCAKIRTKNAQETYDWYQSEGLNLLGHPRTDPRGKRHFYVSDPYGNIFDIIEDDSPWFKDEEKRTGGTYGATVGATNLEKSIAFYRDILGYSLVAYEGEGIYEDIEGLPMHKDSYKRAILVDNGKREGAFHRMFGASEIEIFEVQGAKPNNIFEGRFWGDLGFIHLCYDVSGMDNLRELCKEKGHPFTIDSSAAQEGQSFDMGEAAGYFSYIEDPDGALIEFVETHKVPILKKLGIYLNLKKRDPKKALPNFVVKALGLNRFKD